jgi:tol-pal system protein YbgF
MKSNILFLILSALFISACTIQDKESATRDFNKLYDKLGKIENNINSLDSSLDKSAEKTTGALSDQLQKKREEEKSKADALTADIGLIKAELRSQKINQANHMQTSIGLQASLQEVNAKIEEYSNGVSMVAQRLDSMDARITQLTELYKVLSDLKADKNLSDTETAKNEKGRWHTVGNSVVSLQAEIAELKVLTDALITNVEVIKDPSLKKNIDKKKVTLSGKAMLPEPVTSVVPDNIEVPISTSGDSLPSDENIPKVVSISPDELYKVAYAAYLKGNFDFAISQFNEFLIKFPNSELTLNSRYWIGECYYAKGDFVKSIQTFIELNQKHPKSIKAPSANLKIAYSYFNLNKKDEAIKVLNELIKEYPNSGEAELGKDKLKLIEKKI